MSGCRLLLSTTLAMLLAACSDSTPLTPALPDATKPQAVASAAACPSPTIIQNQIKALYPDGKEETSALGKFSELQKKLSQGKTADAIVKMFDLVDHTLKLYQSNKLVGGQSPATQAKVVSLTSALYCYVGLDAPTLTPAALGPDAATAVVYPTSTDTTIKTGTGWAEVVIPAGAVPDGQPVLITISRLPDPTLPFTGPLATGLDQYPLFYEYTVSPVVTFDAPVTIGICLLGTIALGTVPGSRLRVAHNVTPTSIEILPWATPPALDCSQIETASAATAGPVLAQRSGLPGLMQVGMRQALEWLLPPRLQAAVPMATRSGTCCLGGLAGGFSPFGGVDTLGYLSATSSTNQSAAAGAPVADPPKVRITTGPALGAQPMVGIPVTFEIVAGTGTINGGTAAVVVTTGFNGEASLASWVVSLGANQVRATPHYVPRSGFTPDAVTFDATGGTPLCVAQTDIPLLQCEALVSLYNSTNGASWTTYTEWLATSTPCSWFGIACSGGAVTGIALPSNNLTGTMPVNLDNLGALQILNLGQTSPSIAANHLTGTIPTSLGNLPNLQILDLRGSLLTGTIPASLGGLANLRELYLERNHLTGAIPTELGSATNLRVLNLASMLPIGAGLSGGIPTSLASLINLEYLALCQNPLGGAIPTELGNLTNLQFLCLAENQLTGSIPAELGSLGSLRELYLDWNLLTGSIPPELGSLTTLRSLALYHNQLSGAIPTELGNLANLQSLALSTNQLTGTIPASLGTLANLTELYLYSNQLTGTVPLTVAAKGGVIQDGTNDGRCNFATNSGLHLPDQTSYRAADLNLDGQICGLSFTTVATVEVSPATPTMSAGATLQLTATLRDVYGNVLDGPAITWSSSDASKASVNASGLVNGLTAGTVAIRATSQGVNGFATVTITSP